MHLNKRFRRLAVLPVTAIMVLQPVAANAAGMAAGETCKNQFTENWTLTDTARNKRLVLREFTGPSDLKCWTTHAKRAGRTIFTIRTTTWSGGDKVVRVKKFEGVRAVGDVLDMSNKRRVDVEVFWWDKWVKESIYR